MNGASPAQPDGEDDSSAPSGNLKVRRMPFICASAMCVLCSIAYTKFRLMWAVTSLQWLAPLAVVGGIALMAGAGIVYKEDIKALLHAFIRVVDRYGPLRIQVTLRWPKSAARACSEVFSCSSSVTTQ